jgi:uncharacterized protein with von Willebrand factor type A (vWA) domain
VTARLALLVGGMRAAGARVGLGEVLRAHRALASVDSSVRRNSYFALRAALCSKQADIEVFDAAFEACFGDPLESTTGSASSTRADPPIVPHKEPGHDPDRRRARRPEPDPGPADRRRRGDRAARERRGPRRSG